MKQDIENNKPARIVDWTPNPIAPEHLLKILVAIYVRIAVHPARVSINGLCLQSESSAVVNRRNMIRDALQKENIIIKVSGTTQSTIWAWNKEKGIPDLRMANELIYALSRLSTDSKRRYNQRKRMSANIGHKSDIQHDAEN